MQKLLALLIVWTLEAKLEGQSIAMEVGEGGRKDISGRGIRMQRSTGK